MSRRIASKSSYARRSNRSPVESLEGRRLLAAAAVTHIYELNGNLNDSLGGPALVGTNGTIGATGYSFNSGGGLTGTNVVNANEWSIELKFNWSSAATTGWKRVISFKNLTDDPGLYDLGTQARFYPVTGSGATSVPLATSKNVILTRDNATKNIVCYVNGVQQFTFSDSATSYGTFSSAGAVMQLFRDNTSGGTTGEQAAGFADRVRIYSGVLTQTQVTALQNGGTPPGQSTATLVNGVLTVLGTAAGDAIAVTLSGTNIVAQVGGSSKSFAASSVTSIVVDSGDGADSITIGSTVTKPTSIKAGAGNDTITGGGGNDVIDGGTGADRISGGAGTDTADYSSRTTPVIASIDGLRNDGSAGERDLISTDIENLNGGSAADVLIGSAGNNTINGGNGNDAIFGGAGNDSLDGGAGDDDLSGGDGNDTLTGGTGVDYLAGEAGNDRLNSKDSVAGDILDGGAGTDVGQKDASDTDVLGIESFVA